MDEKSSVYELPTSENLQCRVRGRLSLSAAVVEIHQYRFKGPQSGVFRSGRGFLDLALSPRPGEARAAYVDAPRLPKRRVGDVLLVPANRGLTTEWGEGEQTSVCCAFDDSLIDGDRDGLEDVELEACLDVRNAHVRDALARLAKEIEEPSFCSAILSEAIWTTLIIDLTRHLARLRLEVEAPRFRLTSGQLRTIEELIEQPGRLPAVADLASMCGLSSRHFFRSFRATTGMTLTDYAQARRIDRARTLLSVQRPAIKEIAWRCGFETPAAFSTAFRRAVGVTPREFRASVLH